MSNSSGTVAASSGRLGFLSILGLIFITLKLLKVITWSWWWVLAPIWIPPAVFFGFFILIAILAIIFGSKKSKRLKRYKRLV